MAPRKILSLKGIKVVMALVQGGISNLDQVESMKDYFKIVYLGSQIRNRQWGRRWV